MQRKEDETFEAYKARRAISNQAVKDINKQARNGGKLNTRANRPSKGKVAYSYGNQLRAYFAKKNLEKLNSKKAKNASAS